MQTTHAPSNKIPKLAVLDSLRALVSRPKKETPWSKAVPFLHLPRELRDAIYKMVFCREHNGGEWSTGLFGVNKTVRAEARATFFKYNSFILITSKAPGLKHLLRNMDFEVLQKSLRKRSFQHHRISMEVDVAIPRYLHPSIIPRHYLILEHELDKLCLAIQWNLYSTSWDNFTPAQILSPWTGQTLTVPPITLVKKPPQLDIALRSSQEKCLSATLVKQLLRPFYVCIAGGMKVEIQNSSPLVENQILVNTTSPSITCLVAMSWSVLEACVKVKHQVNNLFGAGQHTKVTTLVRKTCKAWTEGLLYNLQGRFINTFDEDQITRATIILLDCCAMAIISYLRLMRIYSAKFVFEHFVNPLHTFAGKHLAIFQHLSNYQAYFPVFPGENGTMHVELRRLATIFSIIQQSTTKGKTEQGKQKMTEAIMKLEWVTMQSSMAHFQIDSEWIRSLWSDKETREKMKEGKMNGKEMLNGTSIMKLGNDQTIETEPAYEYTVPNDMVGWQSGIEYQ